MDVLSFRNYISRYKSTTKSENEVKGIVMQIEKVLVNDRLHVSKVSWKFRNTTTYNCAVIYPWNLLFSEKLAYFLTVSIVFSVNKKNLTAQ